MIVFFVLVVITFNRNNLDIFGSCPDFYLYLVMSHVIYHWYRLLGNKNSG